MHRGRRLLPHVRRRACEVSNHGITARMLAAAPERQNLIDQIARALRSPPDRAEIALQPRVRTKALFDDFGVADNPAEDVVEVVCNTAAERPQGFQPTRLLQPRFQPSAFPFRSRFRNSLVP